MDKRFIVEYDYTDDMGTYTLTERFDTEDEAWRTMEELMGCEHYSNLMLTVFPKNEE